MYGTQTDLKQQLDRAQHSDITRTASRTRRHRETMRALGARVGADARGQRRGAIESSDSSRPSARASPSPRPRTLLVFGREPGSLRNIDASGGDGFLHDMLEAAGGTDVLADVHRQSVMMSTEMVLTRRPDVIVELRYATGRRCLGRGHARVGRVAVSTGGQESQGIPAERRGVRRARPTCDSRHGKVVKNTASRGVALAVEIGQLVIWLSGQLPATDAHGRRGSTRGEVHVRPEHQLTRDAS